MLSKTGNAKILRNNVFNPDKPHEKVEAKSRTYRIPQQLSSLGFPYASGIFPTTPELGGPSEMFVSLENLSTSASICWLDSRKRSRLLKFFSSIFRKNYFYEIKFVNRNSSNAKSL